MTITCWRSLAENVFASLRKGQAVMVTGRYYMREYTVEEATRTAYELEATAVGHDLSRGTAEFARTNRPPVVARVEVGEDGIPVDESDHYLDIADEDLAELDEPTEAELAALT